MHPLIASRPVAYSPVRKQREIETMPGKHPKDYNIDEVCLWLFAVGLGEKAPSFREQGVDGGLLVMLGDGDLQELGLSGLQGKKLLRSLQISKDLHNEGGEVDAGRMKALEVENEELKKEVQYLRNKLNPPKPAPTPTPAKPTAAAPARQERHVIKGAAGGAARGAVIGAIGGAIAGDAGKGAKMGAAMGAAGGGMQGLGRRRRARMMARG